ncbi:MAG: UvrD-helicase domain-containing protein [Elusimicrobiota bacterium]|jgi:ATP-dependent helicase/nuclease subunit A
MTPRHPSETIRPQDSDFKARRDAAFELRKNIVVEAGAGTGKTTLLTDRIFHTLLAGGHRGLGAPIDRIVAVTFTNKAAGEIKERVSGLLLDILSPGRIEDAERRRRVEARVSAAMAAYGLSEAHVRAVAAKAVSDMDQAAIGTIHHFASTILRLYPVEAGLDPEFKVDMGEGLAELFEDEWLTWLSTELGERPPAKEDWLEVLKLASLDDLKALAFALAAELPAACRPGAGPAVRGRLEAVLGPFRGLEDIKEDAGRSTIRDSIALAGKRLTGLHRALGRPGAVPDELDELVVPRRDWPSGWKGVPGEEIYARGVRLAGAATAETESLVRKAQALVEPFSLRVKELFTRRGFVSNDGLLSRSLALVRDRREVRAELKSRFDAILIDEFQDTDPQQGELLAFLAEEKGSEAGRWQDVRLAPGKLFVVGDPKQSIYRFRGADMRAYDGFKKLALDQGALLAPLQRNFRSSAGLIAPVNEVFQRLMRKEEGLQPEYVPLLAAEPAEDDKEERREKRGPFVSIVGVRDPDKPAEPMKVEDCRAVEARWIADWIKSSHGPSLAYKDIAVLFRVTTSINVYLQALKEAGIPYAVESERYFYGSQEVIDFTNLLRVLDDPEDSLALAGLLRSPLGGLTDAELCGLRKAGPLSLHAGLEEAEGLSAGTSERLARLFRRLKDLRRYAGREPLDAFVARVFEDTFLLELCSAAYHHEQTASNLLKFKRLAKEANDGRGATLKEFIAEASKAAEDPDVKEGESPLADEHYDAVRLLSIHKAKGLEYRAVILPDLRRGRPGQKDAVRQVDWSSGLVGLRLVKAGAADAAMALIEEEEARRAEHESLRLLYVAMTRAKDRLLLLGGAALASRDAGSFAGLLAAAGAWVPKDTQPGFIEVAPGLGVPIEYVDKGVLSRPEKPAQEEKVKAGASLADLAKTWRDRFEERDALSAVRRFVAPTDYLHENEKGALTAGEDAAGVQKRRGRRPAVKEEAALVGEVCHKVLERWDFKKGLAPGDILADVLAVFSQQHPLADWAAIGTAAAGALKSFLGSAAARELAEAEILGREAHFIMPAGRDRTAVLQVVRGSIDVLYRREGLLWVGDYKLDGRGRERKASLYRRQGQAYVDAVARALGEKAGFKLFFLREGEALTVIEPGAGRSAAT